MDIKLAVAPSERLEVYRFRYSVIVGEMGIAIPSADHTGKLIRDADDDKAYLFSAFLNGELVGTSRTQFLRDGDVFPHSSLLQLSQLPANSISVCSRFLVAKAHRGSFLTIRMMQAMYQFLRESEIEFDFILVKQDLVKLYERIGYQLYGQPVTHPEIGDVLPLRLSVRDEEHLRSMRSPLLRGFDDYCETGDSSQCNGKNVAIAKINSAHTFQFLPAHCVMQDRQTVSRYENNVTALSRSIPLVLCPQSMEQVAEIVRESNRTGTTLYPVSTGKNWGLGSRLPVTDDCAVLDLSRLNRILEVNESLRYVVLEPGVTQGQLARYLVTNHPRLSFNLTGAYGETGLLGNTLERGDGMYARIDDLIGVSGVLGNGEPFSVGGNSGDQLSSFSRYSAGPDLVGLFSQGNFGVITRMTFRLIARNDQLRLLWGSVEYTRLAELFDRLQVLFGQRVLDPAITNVGYANRFEQSRSTLGNSNAQDHQAQPMWNFYSIVNATPRIADAIRCEAEAELAPCCRQIGHYVNGQNSEDVPSFLKPLLHPLNGSPDYESIKLVYQLTGCAFPSNAKDVDLDQTPFGMKSYVALVPPIAEHVTRAAAIATDIQQRFKSNLKISFFGDGRTLVTIHFLRTDSSQVRIAQQCEDEIWQQMTDAGYGAYRVNIGQMEKLFKLRPEFFKLVLQLKAVFDPKGIISPGRYCPR